jgi:NAD(P)-dependent dehydrogenase (short-subunit alcohol dehydrogenase family)
MANNPRWTAQDLPDLSGKTIVITGGNSGIGFAAALEFARVNADVVLACRRPDSANEAIATIRRQHPSARVEFIQLDLSSLASVRQFADSFRRSRPALHVLCNNAGVMAIPYRRTADGFEMQFGTNHLGHFALTGLLLEPLAASGGARIVTVSSGAHRIGAIRFDDLNWEHGYRKWLAYGQSKLANLLFMFELRRRAEQAGLPIVSVACHPGYAATNLQAAGPRMTGSSLMEQFWGAMNRVFAQSAAMGALPTLYAATSPDVRGGEYIGPDGFQEAWGYPTKVPCSAAAQDPAAAARLWEISVQMTGVRYDALAPRTSSMERSSTAS